MKLEIVRQQLEALSGFLRIGIYVVSFLLLSMSAIFAGLGEWSDALLCICFGAVGLYMART